MLPGNEVGWLNSKTTIAPRSINSKPHNIKVSYKLGWIVWVVIVIATIVTLLGFLLLDPKPSLLLACSAAANVGIMLWGICRLYKMRLLLSPMASVLIGPAWIIVYSWGNLTARIAGEGRYASNPGSLDYYPMAGLLSTIGLVLFFLIVFALFNRYIQYYRIRYEDLTWRPEQALASSIISAIILIYLSSKYSFVNGYFAHVEGQFDKALSASQYYFITLASIAGVSVAIKNKSIKGRLLGWSGIIIPLVIAVGLRSRTSMLLTMITIGLCWLTLRPDHVKQVLVVGVIGSLVIFALGTIIKQANTNTTMSSITENYDILKITSIETFREVNTASASIDAQYRLAGFELPSAILLSLDHGAYPLYGKGMLGGIISALPSIFRPSGLYSERIAINDGFYGRGLLYADSIGIPLSSGIADLGIYFGPAIYIVIGIYCVFLWRFVQVNPILFVSYLIVGAGIGDLFWEDTLYTPRALAFVCVFLLVLGRLIMPVWTPTTGDISG